MNINLLTALISSGYRPHDKSHFSKPFGRNCFVVKIESEKQIEMKNLFDGASESPAVYTSEKIDIENLDTIAIQKQIAEFEAGSYMRWYQGKTYTFLTKVEIGNLRLIEEGATEIEDLT